MADTARCVQCGTTVAVDDAFCGNCGSPVSAAGTPTARQAAAPRSPAPSRPVAPASTASSAAPGWYPSPDGNGQRYWDGRQWGAQSGGATAVIAEQSRPYRVLRTARGLSLVFAWLTLILGSIGIIAELVGESELGVATGLFFLLFIFQVVWLGLTCVLLFSYPVLIKLALDTEQAGRSALGAAAR